MEQTSMNATKNITTSNKDINFFENSNEKEKDSDVPDTSSKSNLNGFSGNEITRTSNNGDQKELKEEEKLCEISIENKGKKKFPDNYSNLNNAGETGTKLKCVNKNSNKFKKTAEQFAEEVDLLYSQKGDSGVKSLLQNKAQATKKLEIEIGKLNKKIPNIRKEISAFEKETDRVLSRVNIFKKHCNDFKADLDLWPERREKRKSELRQKLDEVRDKVRKESEALSAKMDQLHEKNEAQRLANKELQDKFNDLRADFEIRINECKEIWKKREETTKTQIGDLITATENNERLRAESLILDKEISKMVEEINSYKENANLYTSKFGDIEQNLLNSGDVKKIADTQQMQLQTKIDEIEKEKQADLEIGKQYDRELQQLRTKIQQMKKKKVLTEKLKIQTEAKCRLAQQKYAKSLSKKGIEEEQKKKKEENEMKQEIKNNMDFVDNQQKNHSHVDFTSNDLNKDK